MSKQLQRNLDFTDMESVKILLYLVIYHSAAILTAADDQLGHSAENVHWKSLDFKTIVTWKSKGSDQIFTVLFSEVERETGLETGDWRDTLDCTQISHTECDMSNDLRYSDKTYVVDILTEDESSHDPEALPHTVSPHFNPYKHTNISAATFTVKALDNGRVMVNITDPLTTLHDMNGRQLNIRDVFKKNLKYKISYNKAGNTRMKDYISNSSVAEVPNLDAGESYCFTVAAYIPSRPRDNQLGAWTQQPQCTMAVKTPLNELSLGAWVGIVFILLTVLIVIIIVTVLCCKCCPKRKSLHTSQTSSPI